MVLGDEERYVLTARDGDEEGNGMMQSLSSVLLPSFEVLFVILRCSRFLTISQKVVTVAPREDEGTAVVRRLIHEADWLLRVIHVEARDVTARLELAELLTALVFRRVLEFCHFLAATFEDGFDLVLLLLGEAELFGHFLQAFLGVHASAAGSAGAAAFGAFGFFAGRLFIGEAE